MGRDFKFLSVWLKGLCSFWAQACQISLKDTLRVRSLSKGLAATQLLQLLKAPAVHTAAGTAKHSSRASWKVTYLEAASSSFLFQIISQQQLSRLHTSTMTCRACRIGSTPSCLLTSLTRLSSIQMPRSRSLLLLLCSHMSKPRLSSEPGLAWPRRVRLMRGTLRSHWPAGCII